MSMTTDYFPNWDQPWNIYTLNPPHGWECPRCHRIYAPGTPDCVVCNQVIETDEGSSMAEM